MSDLAHRAYIYDPPRQPHEWWRTTLPTVPVTPDWEKTISVLERVDEGVSLVVLRGRPDAELTLPSPGTQVFGIQVLLAGSTQIALDSGPVCQPRAGALVLSQYSDRLGNEVRLPARSDVHVVDLRLSAEALLRATSFPIAERLRRRFAGGYGSPGHEGLVVSCSASHEMLKLAQSLSSTPLTDPAALRLWRRARAQELLAHLIELLATPALESPLTSTEHEQVLRACGLLESRYAEDWPAARLAQAVGLSEKKLRAGLWAACGKSVHAHLREIRLNHAADRLTGGMSVTQVALAVGYENLSHFGKAFRAQFGVLPSEWKSTSTTQTAVRGSS